MQTNYLYLIADQKGSQVYDTIKHEFAAIESQRSFENCLTAKLKIIRQAQDIINQTHLLNFKVIRYSFSYRYRIGQDKMIKALQKISFQNIKRDQIHLDIRNQAGFERKSLVQLQVNLAHEQEVFCFLINQEIFFFKKKTENFKCLIDYYTRAMGVNRKKENINWAQLWEKQERLYQQLQKMVKLDDLLERQEANKDSHIETVDEVLSIVKRVKKCFECVLKVFNEKMESLVKQIQFNPLTETTKYLNILVQKGKIMKFDAQYFEYKFNRVEIVCLRNSGKRIIKLEQARQERIKKAIEKYQQLESCMK